MPLYVRQLNDQAQSGEEVVCLPQYEGQPAAELLDRKQASHADGGWTVERADALHLHAWKLYDRPEDKTDSNSAGRVDRYFEIRE